MKIADKIARDTGARWRSSLPTRAALPMRETYPALMRTIVHDLLEASRG